jgi:competence protein ComEC
MVLWPPQEDAAKAASNDDSLVMRFADGATSFLLTGDIEASEESRIVNENVPLASDFLKVPHHGSKTSSTYAFLAAVKPRVAVISVSVNNAYGHPSASVVERYATDGVDLLRTDRNGAVTVSSEGQTLAVAPFFAAGATTVLAQAAK